MYRKVVVNLFYTGYTKASNGSPIFKTIELNDVRADLIDSFSAYYYNQDQRLMRKSKNFLLVKEFTEDVVANGVTYELDYLVYNERKYKIMNVLNHKKSDFVKILDTQEVTK